MSVGFELVVDASRRLVHVTLSGFWSVKTVDCYRRRREKLAASLAAEGLPLPTCAMLIDATGLRAQPLDSVAEFAKLIGASEFQPARSALIVASALFKMQGQRMRLPNQRIFEERATALA